MNYAEWCADQRRLVAEVPRCSQPVEHVFAYDLARKSGVWCEFGVGDGTRLRMIAAARGDALVFGFDWFQGLPEDWRPEFPKGSFSTGGYAPDVPGACIVAGRFEDTVEDFFASRVPPDRSVTFVHVDCDLYAGAKVALENVLPHLADGAIICFDEIFEYPGHEEHELRALYETTLLGLHYVWIAYDGGEKAALRVVAE